MVQAGGRDMQVGSRISSYWDRQEEGTGSKAPGLSSLWDTQAGLYANRH